MRRGLVILLFALSANVVTVAIADNTFNQERYTALLNELRCLVCQNQSLSDSDAELAVDLREQVRAMMLDGQSDDEIKAFMTARYGDFVLYSPPLDKRTYVLWLFPFILVGTVLLLLMRRIWKQREQLIDGGNK